MKTRKLYLVFSALALLALLLGACGPGDIVSLAAAGNCPPGYHAVYDEQVGSPGTCQLNTNPLVTVTVPANGKCPPGYHKVNPGGLEFPQFDYCELDPTPTPTPPPQALDSGPPLVKPVLVTVTVPANGKCPPGYHKVNPGGLEFPQLDYCELDPTPTPPFQASNSGIPDLKPAMEAVEYCANKGANLGGVNISFPLDNTLHVEEWFSDSPGHVQCVDDLSNPRTCWGPQSESFEVLLCKDNVGQGQDSMCKTLPVTLGACAQKRESDSQPDPIATSCGHC